MLTCEGRSLFLFPSTMRLRRFLFDLVKNPYFEGLVLFFIIVNCVLLAIDDQSVSPTSTRRAVSPC